MSAPAFTASGVLRIARRLVPVMAITALCLGLAACGGDDGDGNGGDDSSEAEAAAPPAQQQKDLRRAARAADCELSSPTIEGRDHLDPGAATPGYRSNPPTSGDHDPVAATDAAYEESPNVKNLVHALEHGRVILTWDPSIPRQRIAQIRGLFEEDSYHLILTPNATGMPFELAAVAWGQLAGCERASEESFDVLRAFTERYRDEGPEFVP